MAFEPIVLDEIGRTLVPGYVDDEVLQPVYVGCMPKNRGVVGRHQICGGWILLKKVSETHNQLCCGMCHLGIVVPKEVDTCAKLRKWCTEEMLLRVRRSIVITKLILGT